MADVSKFSPDGGSTIYDIKDTVARSNGGHTILNSSGASMTRRSKLQFNGATVMDDSANGKTIVTTTPQSMIGDAWTSGHVYAIGDYCIDGNVLYKCKTAHTSSASYRPPYASYWDAVAVASQLGGEPYPSITGQSVFIRNIGALKQYRLYKEYTVNGQWPIDTTKEFSIPELNYIIPASITINPLSCLTSADNSNRVWIYGLVCGDGIFNLYPVRTTEGAAPWKWFFSLTNVGTSNVFKVTFRCWIDYMI